MLATHFEQTPDAILPEQLDMLQRVFDRACDWTGIEKKGAQAEGLAAIILQLFQSGTMDERHLQDMLDKIDLI